MKITTGYLKGRRVKFPKGIRPTQEKIRKAVFDILGEAVQGSLFLELFAGSGALGIEAVSNGAKEVVFVEDNRGSLNVLRENIKNLGIDGCDILPIEALKAVERLDISGRKFDIIFLDPPYFKELAEKTLQRISACDILKHFGIVIVEHHKRNLLDEEFGDIKLFKQRRYGDKCLSFYRMR